MANIIDPTPEQEASYREWVASRPANVRVIAEQFVPWGLYLLKTSNHRVTVVAFDEQEDGAVTLTVCVSGDFNVVMFERNVFGINPDDLEPCELPGEEEGTGTVLQPDEVDPNIDLLRAMAGVVVKH